MKKECERWIYCNCSQDWLGNNEKTKSTMKHSPKQKSCNISGYNNILCSFFNVKEVGSGRGGGGILLKLLGII